MEKWTYLLGLAFTSFINASNSAVAFSKLLNTASLSKSLDTLPLPLFILVSTKLKLETVELSSKIKSLRFASETLSVISLKFSADDSIFFNEFSIELVLFKIMNKFDYFKKIKKELHLTTAKKTKIIEIAQIIKKFVLLLSVSYHNS